MFESLPGERVLTLIDFEPLFAEDLYGREMYYMPSINMFDAPTEARFNFVEGRLELLNIAFQTFQNVSYKRELLRTIDNHLQRAGFIPKDDIPHDPSNVFEKYVMYESSGVTAWLLWDPDNNESTISLSMTDAVAAARREAKRNRRQEKAFGNQRNNYKVRAVRVN